MSPSERIRVDRHAWRSSIFVFVKLTTLGIDHTLKGDLEEFAGKVVARFYHEGMGVLMFRVDFGGGIGYHKVSVRETQLDSERTFGGETRQVLHYDEGHSSACASPAELAVEPCALR